MKQKLPATKCIRRILLRYIPRHSIMKKVLPTLTSDFKNTPVVCPSGVVSFLYGVCKLLWMLLFNFMKEGYLPY